MSVILVLFYLRICWKAASTLASSSPLVTFQFCTTSSQQDVEDVDCTLPLKLIPEHIKAPFSRLTGPPNKVSALHVWMFAGNWKITVRLCRLGTLGFKFALRPQRREEFLPLMKNFNPTSQKDQTLHQNQNSRTSGRWECWETSAGFSTFRFYQQVLQIQSRNDGLKQFLHFIRTAAGNHLKMLKHQIKPSSQTVLQLFSFLDGINPRLSD